MASLFVDIELLDMSIFSGHRMEWIKDKQGNKIDPEHPDAKSYEPKMMNNSVFWSESPKGGHFLAKHVKPKYFDYNGDIWSHLNIPRNEIIESKGAWVKSNFQAYKKQLYKQYGQSTGDKGGHGYDFGWLTEVFIEKV